jgi:hypothetical protein
LSQFAFCKKIKFSDQKRFWVGGGNDNSNSKTILVPTPAWSRFAMVTTTSPGDPTRHARNTLIQRSQYQFVVMR